MVTSLGHEVVGGQADLATVGRVTASEVPDVASVIVGDNSHQALEFIRPIVNEAACSVIAILDVQDRAFVDRAAGSASSPTSPTGGPDGDAERSTSRRNASPSTTRGVGAFGRRAVTERAKGILMERYSLDEQQASPHAERRGSSDQHRRSRTSPSPFSPATACCRVGGSLLQGKDCSSRSRGDGWRFPAERDPRPARLFSLRLSGAPVMRRETMHAGS